MKRYGHLFDAVCDVDNVRLAMAKASRGKKWRCGIRRTMARADAAAEDIAAMLRDGAYRTSIYHEKTVFEPKRRTIYSLPFFPDRIVHHAVMNVLEPLWDRLLDADCHSCRKGKGCLSGSRRCMGFVRRYKYVLQCDISKFYPSIDHAVCKRVIRRKLKDGRLLALLDEVIDSANRIPGAVPGKNAPIGNLLSQWFGNLYLNEMDVWLRQECGVRAYVRYCDDFLIFADDKAFLNGVREKLPRFLEDELRLRLSRAELYPVSRGVDFLGYRHFPRYVLLRKRVARKVKVFVRAVAEGHAPEFSRARGVAASYNGVLKHANTCNLRRALGFGSVLARYGIAA